MKKKLGFFALNLNMSESEKCKCRSPLYETRCYTDPPKVHASRLIPRTLLLVSLLILVPGELIPTQGQTPEQVSYYKQIRPILQQNCQGCHQPAEPNGGLVVTSYEAFQEGGMGGASFIPGNPEDSMIMEYISGEDPLMPQEGDPLTAAEVELFSRWIAESALDDTPASLDDYNQPQSAAGLYSTSRYLCIGVFAGRRNAGGFRIPGDLVTQIRWLRANRSACRRSTPNRIHRIHFGWKDPRCCRWNTRPIW